MSFDQAGQRSEPSIKEVHCLSARSGFFSAHAVLQSHDPRLTPVTARELRKIQMVEEAFARKEKEKKDQKDAAISNAEPVHWSTGLTARELRKVQKAQKVFEQNEQRKKDQDGQDKRRKKKRNRRARNEKDGAPEGPQPTFTGT